MNGSHLQDGLWVIVVLDSQLFAISCSDVKELVAVPKVSRMPGMPEFVRGIINLRGTVLPLLDLRARLGMVSREEEVESFCSMLHERAQDHRRWLDELERCVDENCEFKLATDPHKCAFGKWYDNYKSDDAVVTSLLRRFEDPHARVHALATKVKVLLANGNRDAARALIMRSREGVLATMMKLFVEFEATVRASKREKAVVLTLASGRNYAVCVDSIVAVERMDERVEKLTGGVFGQKQDAAEFVLERKGTETLVIGLAMDSMFSAELRATLQ